MAPLPDYVAGTITLTNGSTAFTGSGTGWLAAGFREGDTILGIEDNPGVVYVVESVTDNDSGTLTQPWDGPTGTYTYRMRYLSDGQRVTAQARQLIEMLGNGNLQAVAGLPGTPNTFMMFTGAGSVVEVPRTDLISGVAYDVQVDTLADRDAYDSADAGFAVLVANTGDGRAAIYSKLSGAIGDWSGPAYVTGPFTDVTVGSVTEISYGEPPVVSGTSGPGTLELDFSLPGGPALTIGSVTRGDADVTSTPVTGGYELDFTIPSQVAQGDYSGATAYVKGDMVQYQGSSWIALQATTGNTPPSLPTTSNAYWQLLARAGADGAGTVTTLIAGDGISVDSTDPTEPVVSLDIMGESVKTANYTLVAADYGGTFIADDTDPIEFAFEAAATLGAKWWVIVKNIGAGDLTLAPDGSETIDGLSELVLKTGQSRLVTCNGTGLRALFEGGGGGGDDVPTVNPNDMMLALLAADQKNVRIHGAILADPFADQAGIDPEESTGLTYDAELTAFRPAEEGGGQISQGAGTAIGNLILEGGLAKIFDGVTVEGTGSGECARLTNSPLDGWAGKDWGDGNSRVVRAAKLYAPTPHGVSRDTDNTPRSVDARLEGSHNNADWDVLDTQATGTAGSTITEFETEDTTGYRYHRIVIPSYDSNSDKYAAEIEFFEAEELSAGVLVSEIYDVATPPDTLAAAIQILENEEIDINDDIVVSLSRDGGETFTAANLSLMVEVGEEKIYSATGVDVSAQPSGTDLVFKVEVAAKDVLLLGFAMLPGG